jgi:hypothetical protein
MITIEKKNSIYTKKALREGNKEIIVINPKDIDTSGAQTPVRSSVYISLDEISSEQKNRSCCQLCALCRAQVVKCGLE